ncbi:50S ribosomal protein L2 [Candidatus Pacearchaeota archaeon]|nr:50S ribosomal protein L2 [Candidatus Pacearchaeota archaeon]
MGKRIIQRARGHGGPVYRVRKKAFVYEIRYPNIKGFSGESEIIELVHSRAHSAPLARMRIHLKEGENKGGTIMFYAPAFEGAFVGQKIAFNIEGRKSAGDIVRAENMEMGDKVYNIERIPGDGGKIMRSAGTSAVVSRKSKSEIFIKTPSKKEIAINPECLAQIGIIAGGGRKEKPVMKAGKMYHIKKTRSKLWPRTSAVKMNALDHPFGSGRGKRIKSKIAKRNAPPGAKVGHIRPRRTGRKKR